MGKYFGTDGFRGEAGINLTADQGWWGQAPLNFYKIINLDIRTIEIVY